ncbi:MAG: hypothetical protein ACJA0N_000178 [Pseudohongiellaceae bacterium]
MQISSNNIYLQQNIQVNPRPERIVKDDARERRTDVSAPTSSNAAPAGIDLEAEFHRRVELSQVIASSRRSESADQGLPRSAQQALKAFNDAKPSAEQQLGIEIVGVDTFA